ncbi:hypothetical protein ACHAXT_004662 [Thalassiosira profunda]
MSNWGNRYLTQQQISYAARDAWVSAAIVERLQMANQKLFRAEALMQMNFMKNERSMSVVDERARLRKAAKVELKEMQERQKIDEGEVSEADEKRIGALLLPNE